MTRRREAPLTESHVELACGGKQVTVTAAAPLDVVAAKATELWQLVDKATHDVEPIGFGISLANPASEPVTLGPPEFPFQLTNIPVQEKTG